VLAKASIKSRLLLSFSDSDIKFLPGDLLRLADRTLRSPEALLLRGPADPALLARPPLSPAAAGTDPGLLGRLRTLAADAGLLGVTLPLATDTGRDSPLSDGAGGTTGLNFSR